MGHKRKILLIDPPFQLRFSFYAGLVLIISSLAYPYIIYEYVSELVEALKHSPGFEDLKLEESQKEVITLLIVSQITYIALIALCCIYFSHKIAGPIYKLKLFLFNHREGVGAERLYFRKGDYFLEIADEVNKSLDCLEEKRNQGLSHLTNAIEHLGKLNSSTTPQEEILNDMRNALENLRKVFVESKKTKEEETGQS